MVADGRRGRVVGVFGDNPPGMNDSGDPTQDEEGNVDPEIGRTGAFDEHRCWGHEDRQKVKQEVGRG